MAVAAVVVAAVADVVPLGQPVAAVDVAAVAAADASFEPVAFVGSLVSWFKAFVSKFQ